VEGLNRQRQPHEPRHHLVAALRGVDEALVHAFVRIPALVGTTGRRILFRLLSWNPYQHVFLRALDRIEHPLRR
jgi:hypothetical protein